MIVPGMSLYGLSSAMSCSFLPVEASRVVHEQLPLQFGCLCDVGDVVDQQPVVRHVVLEVGVRPIRAPQHPVGELLDDASRERDDVSVSALLAVQGARTGD